jgi:branched-chain amino acid aminotransferase
VRTPSINGTFLNGITRQRVMSLLRDNGHDVEEVTLQFEDVYQADEIFNSGNMGKVMPCNRIEDRLLEVGPVYQHARQLYFEFAETQTA